MICRVFRLRPCSRKSLHLSSTLPTQKRYISSRITTVKFSNEEKRRFFDYTDGRWLWNETQQLRARRVEFDVDALQQVACEAFDATSCVSFSKLDEGSYNKVFHLRFGDGREAIARIPFPLSAPPYIATASEVATMEFAREVLQIPTPRVLAWSGTADARTNSVGAEYIVMEKASGIDLRTRWPLIENVLEIKPLLQDFIEIEKKFERVTFSQFGSIYFKEDVSPELQARPLFGPDVDLESDEVIKAAAEKYRIGPISDRQWWRGGRSELDIDRGPWYDPLSYFTAAVFCELTYIESPAASTAEFRQIPLVPISLYKQLLNLCLKVLPLLFPPEEFCRPTLWHPDFSEANLMVAPTSAAHITSVLDWQYATVAPYFAQAVFPDVFKYKQAELPLPPGLEFPKYPRDFPSWPPDKQAHYRRHHRLIMRQRTYENLHAHHGSARRKAVRLAVPHAQILALLHLYILRAWSSGPHIMNELLSQLAETWPHLAADPAQPSPFDEVSPEFRAEMEANLPLLEDLAYYDTSVTEMTNGLGASGDGLVDYHVYQDVVKECEKLKKEWEEKTPGKRFPFQDGMYSFFLT